MGPSGTAKQARDRRTQAVLPLRGKILNVEGLGPAHVRDTVRARQILTTVGPLFYIRQHPFPRQERNEFRGRAQFEASSYFMDQRLAIPPDSRFRGG